MKWRQLYYTIDERLNRLIITKSLNKMWTFSKLETSLDPKVTPNFFAHRKATAAADWMKAFKSFLFSLFLKVTKENLTKISMLLHLHAKNFFCCWKQIKMPYNLNPAYKCVCDLWAGDVMWCAMLSEIKLTKPMHQL